ncbi:MULTISPECIES: CRISPR-associated endonuclease Cas2 [Parabacteroides]|uniref:CRISPR-associated endonuclease Cas2 n=1 Tax=Parabacteroides provencensis TaxID=1944636 RepID=UPI000C1569E6|nr:CRISPR-associated endonuclease Cas2 [Parabacteroides provencensis]
MMILITYDVEVSSEAGSSRLRKVAKECQNYGQRVQNSVFECVINEADFLFLQNKIKSIIDPEKDSIRFYFLGKNWQKRIECIGKVTSYDVTSELII